jgi:chorismate mutase
MTQNQQNKTCEPALLAFRQDIDKIDDQIISLLKARMEVVTKVGEFKKNNQEKFFGCC